MCISKHKGNYHEPQVLFHDKNGFVVRCQECLLYQVTFGNVAIDMYQEDFSQIANFIDQKVKLYNDCLPKDQKTIFIKLPADGIKMVFSYKELCSFNDMLQTTKLLLLAEEHSN